MSQLVREPTRNDYLLDLACTNIHKSSAKVMPYLSDHKSVLVTLPLPEILEKKVKREVWDLTKADWTNLKKQLQEYDWQPLQHGSAEDALTLFLEVLWLHLVKYIPRREIDTVKRSHPWVNDKTKNTGEKSCRGNAQLRGGVKEMLSNPGRRASEAHSACQEQNGEPETGTQAMVEDQPRTTAPKGNPLVDPHLA